MYVLTDFFDDPDSFVTENRPGNHSGERAPHHMKIGSANCARRQAHDCVSGCFYFRIGDRIDSDVTDVMENDGFHNSLFTVRAAGKTKGGRPFSATRRETSSTHEHASHRNAGVTKRDCRLAVKRSDFLST